MYILGVSSFYHDSAACLIKDGDIISIDCGVLMNGYYGDHAYTFGIGNITKEAEKLLDITKKSLYEGTVHPKFKK